MEALELVLGRRSVRAYQDAPVPEAMVETLLRAAMYAPSAHNSQPWEFLVMRDPAKKAAVSALAPYWTPLKSAPLGILVMANLQGYRASSQEFFIQDCAASTQNILLAARAIGLGGVWLGLYPREDRMQKIRAIYAIPEDILPFSLIAVGYPNETPRPHTAYRDEKVHTDKY